MEIKEKSLDYSRNEFKNHVFISYAHLDNKPLSQSQKGWISRFHPQLESFLSMRLGKEARIWSDKEIAGSDLFSDKILRELSGTAILLVVLTPRYVESEWCLKELNTFCDKAKETGGIVHQDMSRVFKVIKTPVDDLHRLPSVINEVLGYEFFTLDERNRPLELDPIFGEKFEQDYLKQIGLMAWDLKKMIHLLPTDGKQNGNSNREVLRKETIYLAECGRDRQREREDLRIELKTQGYTILPSDSDQMPDTEEGYVRKVDELLAQCTLSIHLVGTSYGFIPDGEHHKSDVILQNERAIIANQQHGLQRLIWLPEGTDAKNPQQKNFINSLLKNEHHLLEGADLLSGSLQEFKTAIDETLSYIESNKQEQQIASPPKPNRSVYLIMNQKDGERILPLVEHLQRHNIDVSIPIFKGDSATIREAHEERLATCDAVLVYYGIGDESWQYIKEKEIEKIRSSRTNKPLLANYTYLAEPQTLQKTVMMTSDKPNMIVGIGEFSPKNITPFINALS